VYHRTLEKYKGLLGHISEFFKNKHADAITPKQAEAFKNWLGKRLEAVTLRERIVLLKACWEWGSGQNLTSQNPWADIVVKVPVKQKPLPFTKTEVSKILSAFRSDRYYSHYADYVEFLLGTGCRIGEVIGLRWEHCKPDCSGVWIGETISRGTRKDTKTGRDRYLPLTPQLQQLLLNKKAKAEEATPDELIFTTPNGKTIDDHNFRNRAWKKILDKCAIPYRKPYICRSTFISHALDAGMNPVDVAELTGHNVRTLYEHYAGSIQSRPKLPELYMETEQAD